jgi:hypothetical protein
LSKSYEYPFPLTIVDHSFSIDFPLTIVGHGLWVIKIHYGKSLVDHWYILVQKRADCCDKNISNLGVQPTNNGKYHFSTINRSQIAWQWPTASRASRRRLGHRWVVLLWTRRSRGGGSPRRRTSWVCLGGRTWRMGQNVDFQGIYREKPWENHGLRGEIIGKPWESLMKSAH